MRASEVVAYAVAHIPGVGDEHVQFCARGLVPSEMRRPAAWSRVMCNGWRRSPVSLQ